MENKERFEIKKVLNDFGKDIRILVDRETGVNYVFYHEGYAGGLTVLLDENGKPIISK